METNLDKFSDSSTSNNPFSISPKNSPVIQFANTLKSHHLSVLQLRRCILQGLHRDIQYFSMEKSEHIL